MQKIGKRKAPPGTQNPEWLFPQAGKSASKSAPKTTPKPAPTSTTPKSKAKQEKKLDQDIRKGRTADDPPAQLIELVSKPGSMFSHFMAQMG